MGVPNYAVLAPWPERGPWRVVVGDHGLEHPPEGDFADPGQWLRPI